MRFDWIITPTFLLAFVSALAATTIFIGRYVSRLLKRIEGSLGRTAEAFEKAEEKAAERFARLDVRVAVVETTVGEIDRRVRRVEEVVLDLRRR